MMTVSVVIPAYNAAATIERALASVMAQTVRPLEVLVVDDGGSDATAAIVGGWPSPVRLLRKTNGGPASARNLGIREARGDWVALLDADDWWLPAKTERQLALLGSPEIGLVHAMTERTGRPIPEEVGFDDLWQRNLIGNSTVIVRRAAVAAVGGFDESMRAVEDYNLWLRIAAAGWRILTCREILAHYSSGVGISTDLQRTLVASLYNAEAIGRLAGISERRRRQKQREIRAQTGREALYKRKLGLARTLLGEAARERPLSTATLLLAAAHLPTRVLDAKRCVRSAVLKRPAAGDGRARLFGRPVQPIEMAAGRPRLLVIVDAEEEFDWATVPSTSVSVASMRHQGPAQRLFEQFGVVPTYAVDYAVASQLEGRAPLLEFLADGRCEIGAQLHPWINPPLLEDRTLANSYAGNLPSSVESAKIRLLTESIGHGFGVQPILYRAGRYGLGENTARLLLEHGYRIDCSVRPLYDLRAIGGPEFMEAPTQPFWFGPGHELLEIPVTTGLLGSLSRFGRRAYHAMTTASGRGLRLPGLVARSGLLERFQLSPEGTSIDDAVRLTRALLGQQELFVVSYHSPSLQPGNTPYVRSAGDLGRFLRWLEEYLGFFLGELGGLATTPAAVLAELAEGHAHAVDRWHGHAPAAVPA